MMLVVRFVWIQRAIDFLTGRIKNKININTSSKSVGNEKGDGASHNYKQQDA